MKAEPNNIFNENNKFKRTSASGMPNPSNVRIKPKFFKLMGQIMNYHIDPILNYLDLIDLCKTRSVNKLFLAIVHEYYPKRLRFEVDKIKWFQDRNSENFQSFMKIIDSQIPISQKNWLDFDLNSVIAKLKLLDKKVITNLRGIKNIGKISEAIYAPFCIIFGFNKNSYSMIKNEGWKKISGKILADPDFNRKLANLDMDNLIETDMLDAFVYLNLPELDIETIKKYSPDLEKLLLWCQAVLSYHILIHPFTYRNDKSQIAQGTELHTFVISMNKLLDRFYKFKRFLINLNIMNIPLAEYVFNLQHNREKQVEIESAGKLLNEKQIGTILSFLHYSVSYKLICVSKKFREGFKHGIDFVIHEILKEIFFLKLQASEKMSRRIPILFENNIYSQYFLMIDDILTSDYTESNVTSFIPFLSKEQLNDIKNIKIETDVIKSVTKVLCLILNEKPERKASPNGDIKILYLEKVKLLVINGALLRLMRNVNKLDMNQQKINMITEELTQYLTVEKLEEIKKTNRGVYQLLIWELFVYEYLKTFNPFDFINTEYITNRFEKEEVDIIKYYCEIMNYLKYNLKIKYRFNAKAGKSMSFDFKKMFDDLRGYLTEQNMTMDLIFDNSLAGMEFAKIAKVYFESKDLIPIGAKPALYERIFNEIIKIHTKQLKQPQEGNIILEPTTGIYGGISLGQLGTIKEENSPHDNKPMNLLVNSNPNFSNPMFQSGTYHKEINKLQLLTNLSGTKQTIIHFQDIPMEIIVKNLLFFLDINSLPKFALVNKKANECIKTHIFIRLFFLNKEKKQIEQENADLIQSVELKRKNFFEEYEIEPPSKEHSCTLMNIITSDDIMELRQCFKKYNKNYENFISPLVLLLGGKAATTVNPDATKTTSFFLPAQKLLNGKDFIRKLRDLELETIPHSRFKAVEKIIESPEFNIEKIKQFSPSLHHLLSWIMGVIEFHRVIRKYTLSSYDYDIIAEEEINFCTEMDNILLLYYKLLRYANKYCKKYEKTAQNIMVSMNILVGK